MQVLLSSIGSRGDVQPIVALALELQALGHRAQVVRGSQFQRVDRVLRAGMYSDRTGPEEADRWNRAGQTGPAFQRTIAATGRPNGARAIPGHRRSGAWLRSHRRRRRAADRDAVDRRGAENPLRLCGLLPGRLAIVQISPAENGWSLFVFAAGDRKSSSSGQENEEEFNDASARR